MISIAVYLRENLAGAWAVMNGRAEGLQRLDTSIDGFWRSFAAIGLIAPLVMFTMQGMDQALVAYDDFEPVEFGLIDSIAGDLDVWVLFPVFFALVARYIGLMERYIPFIVAHNWGWVIIEALFVPIAAFGFILAPSRIVSFAFAIGVFLFILLSLRFSYLLARTALAVPPATAIPIVVIEILLSLLLSLLGTYLFTMWAG